MRFSSRAYIQYLQTLAISALFFAHGTAFAESRPFTIQDLSTLLTQQKITSIEELLKQLPDELKKNYTLVYKSESKVQPGTVTNPRAILFSRDGSFSMTFNGDPTLDGYFNIEALQFVKGQKTALYDIHFDPKRTRPPQMENNPASCLQCHGSEPRPLWGSYPFWSGVYGSEDDLLLQDAYHNEEFLNFQSYRANAKTHPRYQVLKVNPDSNISPYTTDRGGKFSDRPNTRLGTVLADQQLDVLFEKLNHCEEVPHLAPLLLMVSACRDEKAVDPVVEALNKELLKRNLVTKKNREMNGDFIFDLSLTLQFLLADCGIQPQQLSLTLDSLGAYFDTGQGRLHELLMPYFLKYVFKRDPHLKKYFIAQHLDPKTTKREAKENLLNLSTFKDPESLAFAKEFAIVPKLMKVGEFSPGYSSKRKYNANFGKLACDRLALITTPELDSFLKSHQTVSLAAQQETPAEIKATATRMENVKHDVIQTCFSCHHQDNSNNAPVIPFDNEMQLSALLKNGLMNKMRERLNPDATYLVQMPPSTDEMEPSKKIAIREWLESLSGR